jgi:predicted alpha/beta superfamily hydrolase
MHKRVLKTATGLLALLAASLAAGELNTDHLQGLGDTRYHQVTSKNVGRDYHIYVMLPDGYDESAGDLYPTVYVLDGGGLFPLMAAYSQYLTFAEEMPNSIIVGIAYGEEGTGGGNFRSTDYTARSSERSHWGGAGQFQGFLSKELLPFIEEEYPSLPERRVIFGQSLGGQFVLYTALTEPDLFWGHIASNPALHRNLPFFLTEHSSSPASDEPSRLFVASGTNDDPGFREPALEWIEFWSGRDKNPWLLKTTDLDGHSHMSAPPAAFREGMLWLFSF